MASQKEPGLLGFAYFNVIAKNWFFQKARELVKKNKMESELHKDCEKDFTTESNFFVESIEDSDNNNEFWLEFYNSLDGWKSVLTKKTEKKVLEAVIFLMTHSDLVPIYNKKAIYMFLREITGLNSKQVIINLKKIRQLYEEWKKDYYSRNDLDEPK